MKRLNKQQRYKESQEIKEHGYADMAGITTQVRRRYREQEGVALQHNDGSWWLRYYVDDPDGIGRIRVSEPLNVVTNAEQSAVKTAQMKRMKQINADCKAERKMPQGEMTLSDFWVQVFLPWMKGEGQLRESSWRGAAARWRLTIEPVLGRKQLRRFTTVDANNFLSKLARQQTKNGPGLTVGSLQQYRGILSRMFGIATSKGYIEYNPMFNLNLTGRARRPNPTIAYTEEEMDAMLEAIPTVKGKLFLAFCCYAAMRPSEVAALKWDAIDMAAGKFEVRDAAASGRVVDGGGLKTANSLRTLQIHEPLKGLLERYRAERKKAEGYLFERKPGHPVNHNNYVYLHVKPYAEKVCARWSGLYAGRRGCATALTARYGINAAYQVMGNTYKVAADKYVKPSIAEGQKGQTLLEDAYLKRQAERSAATATVSKSTS